MDHIQADTVLSKLEGELDMIRSFIRYYRKVALPVCLSSGIFFH